MILKLLLQLVLTLLEVVFGWVSFPAMPTIVTGIIDMLFEYMGKGMGIVFLFVSKELVLALLPVVLIVENFDKLYSVAMWILKKIPMLNIK